MTARSVKVKPHYLGLLNGISVGEARGGVLLRAWAGATCDAQLAETLSLVAARETDHSEVFAARICEFGYDVRDTPDTTVELCALLSSEASDADKVAAWNAFFAPPVAAVASEGAAPPSLQDRLSDRTIDRTTRTLLRWYLDEEIDSARRLREAFARVAPAPAAASEAGKPPFLGLLNRIAVGEGLGGLVLQAWASATRDPDLKACLCLVAERELDHKAVFQGRIEELSYSLREGPAGDELERTLAFYAGDAPDCEKATKARASTGAEAGDALDRLEAQIAGPEYDPVTRRLLTWYIGEERDSAQKLAEAYARVMEAVGA